MLYVQLYPWATLLKEGKAVAILRAAGGSKGKAETAVECQCWRKVGGFANHDVTRPVCSFLASPACLWLWILEMGRKGRSWNSKEPRPTISVFERILRTIVRGG